MIKSILALLAIIAFVPASNAAGSSTLVKMDKCSEAKVIYSMCSAEQQLKKFQETYLDAQKKGKKVVMILGADWCGPCRGMSKDMKANQAGMDKLGITTVIIKINGDIAKQVVLNEINSKYKISTHIKYDGYAPAEVKEHKAVTILGYPTLITLDPAVEEVVGYHVGGRTVDTLNEEQSGISGVCTIKTTEGM